MEKPGEPVCVCVCARVRVHIAATADCGVRVSLSVSTPIQRGRVAVVLRGVHYRRLYAHFSKSLLTVDYRRTRDYIMRRLIEPLRAAHDVVEVYVTSYTSTPEMQSSVVDYFGVLPGLSRFFPMSPHSTQAGCARAGLDIRVQPQ